MQKTQDNLQFSAQDQELFDGEALWVKICHEVELMQAQSPSLKVWLQDSILNQDSFSQALAFQLAKKLSSDIVSFDVLKSCFENMMKQSPAILHAAIIDLEACFERDPACEYRAMPLLFFKGYQALQSQRLAHQAWLSKDHSLAYFLQSQMSICFAVDMHPAVVLGHGIMLDHATGVVMGETTVIGNDVSILHGVTLGGCGVSSGVRHPNIGDGVLISAGAKILGAVKVGEGAKVAAGSLVLEDIPAHSTVAGVPARIVGKPKTHLPATDMDQTIDDESSD